MKVINFFSCDGVDDGVCLGLLGPMVIPEGDGHVSSVHSAEVVWGQVAGSEILRASGHPRRLWVDRPWCDRPQK
jgi:hypothetical protein